MHLKKSNRLIPLLILALLSQQISAQTLSKENDDKEVLGELNARFIKNFINQDTIAHNEIIHKDFVCITSAGQITNRKEYMRFWANGYISSGYTSFDYADENIRIFGSMALVRSKTVYTKSVNGEVVKGSTLYTDTYMKENGRWRCVQAQLTPVK